jgi:roadblock/LC7 domain-containing protein
MWIQADIDNLKTAIASGVLVVSYDGPPKRLIQYQSLPEMRALLAEMVADVAAANGTRVPNRYASGSKGF